MTAERQLPAGTVTFMLTDIEGSTSKWEHEPAAMRQALAVHNRLVADAVAEWTGCVIQERGEGDSVFAVFQGAADAICGATEVQRELAKEVWPEPLDIRVRIGINTGEGELRDGVYHGNAAINPCARLRAVAHGGQVLVSGTTAELARLHLPAEIGLRDLGEHRLRDIVRPMRIFQVLHPDLRDEFPALKTLANRPHNLPAEVTSFVGRDQELRTVKQLVADSRLVTLVGVGGVGKTRLAVAAARELLDEFEDGAFLVELGPVADSALVAEAVAKANGVGEELDRTYEDALLERLRDVKRLLVVDNCEHLVEECARLVDRLLRECPGVRVLATSREALGINGETAWRVPSLDESEAVRLFAERAAAGGSQFQLGPRNFDAVVQVCQRLDRIPLAIELAAARAKVMAPDVLLTRLEDRFRLLTGGSRTAVERQHTLRAAIDWSYDLLPEQEKAVFDRLSVFAGGFDIGAAEEICANGNVDRYDIVDLVSRLVDKSLVVTEGQGSGRLRMLETLRQYARERLVASGDADRFRRLHAEYFLKLAESTSREHPDVLARDFDNIRAAIDWANDAEVALAARLVTATAWFFTRSGRVLEGTSRLEDILARLPNRDAVRAEALFELAWFGFWRDQPDPEPAVQAAEIAREIGADELLRRSLHAAAILSRDSGPDAAARAVRMLEEALALERAAGDVAGEAAALNGLGVLNVLTGNLPRARAYLEESFALKRKVGAPDEMAFPLQMLAMVSFNEGDLAGTSTNLSHALDLFERANHTAGTTFTLQLLARTLGRSGLAEPSLRLQGAVDAIQKKTGIRTPSHLPFQLEIDPDELERETLRGRELRESGAQMSLEEAVAYARREALPALLGGDDSGSVGHTARV